MLALALSRTLFCFSYVEIVRYLLLERSAVPVAINAISTPTRMTALCRAVANGDLPMVSALLGCDRVNPAIPDERKCT